MFKDKLKELREKEGLSQQELADKLFVSRSAVAKWENGNGIPSDVNLDAICELFSVTEEWLLDRKELKNLIRTNKFSKKKLMKVLFILIGIILILLNINKYDYWALNHPFAAIVSGVTVLYLVYNLFNKNNKVFKIINIVFLALCYILNIVNWLITSIEADLHFFYIILRLSANIDLGLAIAQFSSIINLLILTVILIVDNVLKIHKIKWSKIQKKKKIILISCVVLTLLLLPIPSKMRDGTIQYNAILYDIYDVHRPTSPLDWTDSIVGNEYIDGTIIKILGYEVFNNTEPHIEIK